MIEAKLDQLANLLIRPRRRTYNEADLGPTFFKTKYGYCVRRDFQVQFKYGNCYSYPAQPSSCQASNQQIHESPLILLHCSIFFRSANTQAQATLDQRVCVLAMHGNTGSRMSTISLLQPVLSFGMSFAIFDFAGCGNSQGEYVTLGYYEKYQISAVLEAIHKRFGSHRFILYGRSMGAASSLFYCTHIYPQYLNYKSETILRHYQNQMEQGQKWTPHSLIINIINKMNGGHFGYEIIGIVLDSPYYETKELFMGAVGRRLWFVPSAVIEYLLKVVEARALRKLANVQMGVMDESAIKIEHKQKEKEQGEEEQGPKIFSLVNDIRIPSSVYIPFPVFIIYGLQDDVISQAHTWELFRKLDCQNKKLHVLQEQGHGGHRDDSLKMYSLQWILRIEEQKFATTAVTDARILGVSIEQYMHKQQMKQEKKGLMKPRKQNDEKMSSQNMTGQFSASLGSMASVLDHMSEIQNPRKWSRQAEKMPKEMKEDWMPIKTKEDGEQVLLSMTKIASFSQLEKRFNERGSTKMGDPSLLIFRNQQ